MLLERQRFFPRKYLDSVNSFGGKLKGLKGVSVSWGPSCFGYSLCATERKNDIPQPELFHGATRTNIKHTCAYIYILLYYIYIYLYYIYICILCIYILYIYILCMYVYIYIYYVCIYIYIMYVYIYYVCIYIYIMYVYIYMCRM